jgi:hypothetical protein
VSGNRPRPRDGRAELDLRLDFRAGTDVVPATGICRRPIRGHAAREVETDICMKDLVAAVIIAALTASQASAAERHSRTPHRFNFEAPSGGSYESMSQGHQSYPNPDRQPYVTQFDRPD